MNFLSKKMIKPFIVVSIIAVSTLTISQSDEFDFTIDELFESYTDDTEYDNTIIQYADGSEYRSNPSTAIQNNSYNNNDPVINRNINPNVNGQNINYAAKTVQNNSNYNTNNQGNLMTIAKCVQNADRIVGSAFMLPPGWQVQCHTEYNLHNNTLWSDPIFKARNPNNNIQLSSEKSQHFYYDRQMREQIISSKSLDGVDISVFGPDFARSHYSNTQEFIKQYDASYPKAIDLVEYASYRSHEFTQLQGYQVYHVSRDPIANTLSTIINNNNVTINAVTVIAHQANNPNSIKMIKIIQAIIPVDRADHYSWHLIPLMATGNRQNEAEMSKLINLIINTQQENPKFSQMVGQVNINMAKQANQTFANISEITTSTYAEINSIYQNTYKNASASSERLQSKWVDGMMEVENYVNPYDGKPIKMPMHNKYYFSNNLDDYLGTNNPLIDPNVDLNFLYNWRKLEQI